MKKIEFIEKYGEEAWRTQLEKCKQWREIHKEEVKEQRKQHYEQNKNFFSVKNKEEYQKNKERILDQRKQHYEQNKEKILKYRKIYRQTNHEKILERKRKNECMFAYCIPEEIEQIENYELAKKDNFKKWCIHHRLETHNSDGKRRLINLSVEELKALDMYYNRPANELIFLTNSEHRSLHGRKKQFEESLVSLDEMQEKGVNI